MKSVKFTSIPKINTVMEMIKEKYEAFGAEKDDDLFGKLELSSETEDDDEYYVWSIYGQCWLPK